jgi:hypothetical protein
MLRLHCPCTLLYRSGKKCTFPSAYLLSVMSVFGHRLEAQGLRVYVERPVNRTEFPTLPVCDPTRQGASHAMIDHDLDYSCMVTVQGSSMYLDHLLKISRPSVFAQCPPIPTPLVDIYMSYTYGLPCCKKRVKRTQGFLYRRAEAGLP